MMAQLDESSVRQERPWKSLEMISDGLWFSLPLIGTLRKKKFAVNHPVDRHACHFFLSLSFDSHYSLDLSLSFALLSSNGSRSLTLDPSLFLSLFLSLFSLSPSLEFVTFFFLNRFTSTQGKDTKAVHFFRILRFSQSEMI